MRWRTRLGAVEIAGRLNVPASTVHAVLVRARLNRLSHVVVKKLGNIPDGGGWRFVGRPKGDRNRAATPGKPRNAVGNPKLGTAFVHTVIVKRVISDNGSAYKSHAWRDAGRDLQITPKKTRPYRPQTNGKIERFHRTLAEGWAYARHYPNETTRRSALSAWLHEYNHHRLHTGIGKTTPISKLTNLPEQYT